MNQITLKKEETQEVRIPIGSSVYNIRLFPFRKLMYIDIVRDGEYIVAGKRVMANQWLIPAYIKRIGGNFRFETYDSDCDDYVWYSGFNTKFRLVVYGESEIESAESEGGLA